MIVILWIALTIVVTIFGSDRKIGAFVSFFVSLILSPLVGFICVVLSDKKKPQEVVIKSDERKRMTPLKPERSVADELIKLAELRDKGIITADEFAVQKDKLFKI